MRTGHRNVFLPLLTNGSMKCIKLSLGHVKSKTCSWELINGCFGFISYVTNYVYDSNQTPMSSTSSVSPSSICKPPKNHSRPMVKVYVFVCVNSAVQNLSCRNVMFHTTSAILF